MANIRLIKGRIKSAKNISQITKAMELVAASKMRKAQMQAQAGKLYAEKIYDMVMTLSTRTSFAGHPLLTKPAKLTGKKLVVFISSNKGLCGGLNTNLFRFYLETHPKTPGNEFVTLGKKGVSFITQMGGSIKADFSDTSSFVSVVPAVTELVMREYIVSSVDSVVLVYNDFISIMRQEPKAKTILPLTIESVGPTKEKTLAEFTIEPSVDEVFDSLLPHYLENQIRDAILEAEASEQSARMLAMRNATDNANDLVNDLSLVYNKARQEKITYEISDIITATMGLQS